MSLSYNYLLLTLLYNNLPILTIKNNFICYCDEEIDILYNEVSLKDKTTDVISKFKDALENKEITKNIDLSKIPIVHMGRSLTLVNHAKIPFCNGTRLGICMYGMAQNMPLGSGLKSKLREIRNRYTRKKLGISETTTTNNLKLNTAITLCSEVIDIKTINAGDFVGYGALFIANSTMKIATIPIGYADGVSRGLSNKISAILKGKKVPQIGNITMDQMMFDVTEVDDVNIGDTLTLIGEEDDQVITIDEWAKILNTIHYELTCRLKVRLPRVYTR